MTFDQKIQFIIEHIPMQQSFNGNEFYRKNWGEETIDELKLLEEKMLASRLIKVDSNSIYSLTILGKRVLANGGWVKFVKEREQNLQLQEDHAAEYEALKQNNAQEKELNLSQNTASTASNKPPTASEGMSFSNVIFLIAFLLLIAFIIWRVWG